MRSSDRETRCPGSCRNGSRPKACEPENRQGVGPVGRLLGATHVEEGMPESSSCLDITEGAAA